MPNAIDRWHTLVDGLIQATNAFDVERVLALFTPEAVVDDPSTGHRFDGREGIRSYIKQYFVSYQTVSRILTVEGVGPDRARARVDFTGDFGHEIGVLELSIDAGGLIARVDANLE